ncbi:MAG: AI-2E family transporter [Candidatus Taylorbacteria bacterium]|nr:AI-2E family transporter [Candidatus Taylorbacteria bacterium]
MINDGKNFTISISSGTVLKTILYVVLFYVLFMIRDLILVVFGAVVIASSIEPVTKWLGKRRIRRLPSVIIIYFLVALILFGIFFFFLPQVLSEALTYVNSLPQNMNTSDLWSPIKDSSLFSSFTSSVQGMSSNFSLQEVVGQAQAFITGTGAGVLKTANFVFGGALSFILIIVLSFYFAAQEDGVGNFLRIVTPPKSQKYIIDLWKRSQLKIGYWFQGQLFLGLLIGILIYVPLLILGVKHALLLATLAGIFELVPIFGPLLSAFPGILVAYVDGGVTLGLIVAGVYIIIQQLENHLIYPLVVRKIVGISPIVVILSLVIGAKLAGFLGILLSVPIAAVFMEFINDVEKDRKAVVDAGLV